MTLISILANTAPMHSRISIGCIEGVVCLELEGISKGEGSKYWSWSKQLPEKFELNNNGLQSSCYQRRFRSLCSYIFYTIRLSIEILKIHTSENVLYILWHANRSKIFESMRVG